MNLESYLQVLMIILLLMNSSCQRSSTSPHLRAELLELRSKAGGANSQELVKMGERALEIVDDVTIADELVEDGIENVSFVAFEEALDFFKMALEKDRGNEKALFYFSLLRPYLPLRGVYHRASLIFNFAPPRGLYEDSFVINTQPLDFWRYLMDPETEQIRNPRELVPKVIEPFLEEVRAGQKDFSLLLTNPELDLEVKLPEEFAEFRANRVRSADLRLIKSAYLYMYMMGKLYLSYQFLPRQLNDRVPVSRNEQIDDFFRDPAMGLLMDPLVFKEFQGNALGLIEALNFVQDELLRRFIGGQNSSKDLVHFDQRTVSLCLPRANLNQATKAFAPICTTQETPLVASLLVSAQRNWFERTYNDQLIQEESDLDLFKEIQSSRMSSVSEIRKGLALLKQYLVGPAEISVECVTKGSTQRLSEKVWVDFASFAKNPIRDLKKLADPIVMKGSPVKAFYPLKDPTLNGLFRPHMPCYGFNFELYKEMKKRGAAPASVEPFFNEGEQEERAN